jgi:hypothetical protein
VNLVAIYADIEAALAPAGVFTYDHEPDEAELPCLFPGFDDIDFGTRATYAGGTAITIPALLLVDRQESRYAQMRLRAALSTEDTLDAIEGLVDAGADEIYIPPLKPLLESYQSAAWKTLMVRTAGEFSTYELAGVTGLGVVLSLDITAH